MLERAIQFFHAGGWVMYPLLLMSLLSITLMFERAVFWTLGPQRRGPRRLMAFLALIDRGEVEQLREHSARDRTLEGVVVRASVANGAQSESALIAVIESLRPSIERFAPTLGTIIAAAPLLGILGTVTGIIQSFDLLGDAAAVSDPTIVAGGIAEALYTTAFGLTVALIAIFPHVYFKTRAERTLGRLEILAGALADMHQQS